MRTSLISTFVMTLSLIATLTTAQLGQAQGIQDLFRRPQGSDAAQNDDELDGLFRGGKTEAKTQGTDNSDAVTSPSDRQLVEDHGSVTQTRQNLAMELRQARAIEAYRQRQARLEVAHWSGNPTLRPSWHPTPSTSSRYPTHHTMYVPVYIRR